MKFFLLLMFSIILVFLVVGVKNDLDAQVTYAGAKVYTATLTDWVRDPNYKTADFCPKYEFTTEYGKMSYIGGDMGEACTSNPDDSKIGRQTMQVIVDPNNHRSIKPGDYLDGIRSGLPMEVTGIVFFSLLWLITLWVGFFRKGTAPANANR